MLAQTPSLRGHEDVLTKKNVTETWVSHFLERKLTQFSKNKQIKKLYYKFQVSKDDKGLRNCCVCMLVTELCQTLCHLMAFSLPGSSVLGIHQARILEWVAISFSRGSSQLRDWIRVSHVASRFFTIWATREAPVGFPI